MTAHLQGFDRVLADVLEADGPRAVASEFLERSIASAVVTRQRRPRVRALDRRAWPPVRPTWKPVNAHRPMAVAAVTLLVLALAVTSAVLWIGSGPLPSPVPTTSPGPASHLVLTDGPDAPASVAEAVGLRGGGLLAFFYTPQSTLTAAVLDAGGTSWRSLDSAILPFATLDAALLLDDGRVLLLGEGDQVPGAPVAVTFDARTEQFTPAVPATGPRVGGMPVLLGDDRVLLLGGSLPGTGAPQQSVEVFDARLQKWSSVGNLELFGASIAIGPVRLADGRVFFTLSSVGSASLDARMLDPVTGTSTPARLDLPGRSEDAPLFDAIAARLLSDGRVLLFASPDDSGRSEIRIWTPGELKLQPFAVVPGGHQVVSLRDGRFVLANGFPGTATVWDPGTGATESSGPFVATYPLAIALPDGRVALVGGYVRGAPIGTSGTPPASRAVQFLSFE